MAGEVPSLSYFVSPRRFMYVEAAICMKSLSYCPSLLSVLSCGLSDSSGVSPTLCPTPTSASALPSFPPASPPFPNPTVYKLNPALAGVGI